MRLGEQSSSSTWLKNSSRQTWSFFSRRNMGWKVKLSTLNYQAGNGDVLTVKYITPTDYLSYLMATDPGVLVGGLKTPAERSLHLRAFWEGFRLANGDHDVFREHGHSLGQTLPLLFHGDEGRGKRRGNTVVAHLEVPLSLYTAVNCKKRRLDACDCVPPPASVRKYSTVNRRLRPEHLEALRHQSTTMKGHSFLHRLLLFIIPSFIHHSHPQVLNELLKILASDLRRLFYEGFDVAGRHYAVALIGCKGDLKWYKKIALERSWENQGSVRNIACCHECGAGVDGCPMEDMSETPIWGPTRYTSRPWTNPPPLLPVPVCRAAPEKVYRRDPFHLCRVGIYRDLAGSCLLWMVVKGYFGNNGDVGEKLDRAHGAFKLYCTTTGKSPALRTFSRSLMMFPRLDAYPWSNTKGSDTTLLLGWLGVQCQGFANAPLDPSHVQVLQLMKSTIKAARGVFQEMNAHRLWQNHSCSLVQHAVMQRFVTGYMLLASHCLNDRFNGFAVKPKLHLFKHQVLEVHEALSRGDEVLLNWMIYNCEASEDLVGRVCRLSRRLDSRRIGERVLQCYLLKADILHRRFKRINKIWGLG